METQTRCKLCTLPVAPEMNDGSDLHPSCDPACPEIDAHIENPNDRWVIAKTAVEDVYPCRCTRMPCKWERCPCWGRIPNRDLPRGCCGLREDNPRRDEGYHRPIYGTPIGT